MCRPSIQGETVVGGFGLFRVVLSSLWIVLDGFGSFWVVMHFSSYVNMVNSDS